MQVEDTNQPVRDLSIERLQFILATEQHPLSISEVKEIAFDLIHFFELLAEDNGEQGS
jgi:hypothetical protein